VRLSYGVATNLYNIDLWVWTPDGGESLAATVQTTTNAATTYVVKASGNPAGYYGITITGADSTTAGGVFVPIKQDTIAFLFINYNIAAGEKLCHLSAPSFLQNQNAIQQYRILGLSLDYENTAAESARAGLIAGFQAPSGTHYTDWVQAPDPYAAIASLKAQKAVTMEAFNGMYGFLLPNGPDSFGLRNFMEIDALGNCTRSYYPLDHGRDYLIICAQCPNIAGSGSIFTPQSGTWKCGLAFEYMTTTQMRDPERPQVNEKIFKYAAKIMRATPQFHENPKHKQDIWEKIKGFIGSAWNWVVDNHQSIIKGIEMVAPLVAAL